MASENESVMDVCSEWRDCIEAADPSVWNDERIAGLVKTTKAQQIAYLDRIEAAWKRERVEVREIAATTIVTVPVPVGNAEAMHKAIFDIRNAARSIVKLIAEGGEVLNFPHVMQQIIRITDSALAAPARNCDLPNTEERYTEFCSRYSSCSSCPHCRSGELHCDGDWLLAPAEKGGAE